MVGALGGGLAHGVDLVGRELEQVGALLDRGGAEGLERGLGQLGRAGGELAGGEPVGGVERGAVAWIDRAEGPGVAEDGLSGEVHRADDTRGRGLGFGCHGSSVSLLFNAGLLPVLPARGRWGCRRCREAVKERGDGLAETETWDDGKR